MSQSPEPLPPDVEATEPVERREPDPDPGLAPDPQHEVRGAPPEGAGPGGDGVQRPT
jgi:hypothetical protein